FSKARNISIDHATSDWIIWTDADDRINSENCDKIKKIIQSYSPTSCFSFMIKNSQDGILGDVFNQVRLFPRHKDIRFRYKVHEQVLPSIQSLGYDTLFTDIIVFHTGYDSPETVRKKQERNLPILLKEIEERKDNPVIVYTYAGTLVDLGRFEESIPYYEKAMELSESFQCEDHIRLGVPVALAGVYGRLKKWEQSQKWATLANKLNPHHPQVLCMLGELAEKAGQEDEAIKCFEEVLTLSEVPTFIPVNVNMQKINACSHLSSLYMKKGAHDKMVRTLELAITIRQGGRAPLPSDKGDIYFQSKAYEKAAEAYAEAINNPASKDWKSYLGMAKLCLMDNRGQTALDVLTTSIERCGEHEDILKLIADIYSDNNLKEKAAAVLERLKTLKASQRT
ncbi:MAG: tetratricopeptide repeat protein, partial [Fibrobacteres bacterium]|nr:tetratricopeptide repeat protein [Fibrobacterota bacterium]